MINRKLVRPNLAEIKERMTPQARGARHDGARESNGANGHHENATARASTGSRRRPAPPDVTSAEAFYYLKQMNSKTPMIVVLDGGERLEGHIEWYDRGCLKVHREDAPNLLVYKHTIKYLYKAEDEIDDA